MSADLNGMMRHSDVGGIFPSASHKGAPFLCDINLQVLKVIFI